MDVPGVKANELDAKVAAKVADGTSATAAQLNATYAPLTAGSNGVIRYALSGDPADPDITLYAADGVTEL